MPRSTERTEASTKSLPRRRRIKRSHFRPDRSTHFDSRSKKAWTNSLTYSLTDKQVQPNFFSATHQWEFPDAKACYRMLLILQFWIILHRLPSPSLKCNILRAKFSKHLSTCRARCRQRSCVALGQNWRIHSPMKCALFWRPCLGLPLNRF